MATAFAANGPLESAPAVGLDDKPNANLSIPIPLDRSPTSGEPFANPQLSPRSNGPPPNPPFVFPAKPSPSSAPSSYSRATGRRPKSAIEIQGFRTDLDSDNGILPSRLPALPSFSFNPGATMASDNPPRPRRSPALPDFSFNPGANLPAETSMLSPPLSPASPRAIPSRPGGPVGHRRGGSEFVGGKLRNGEAITVMSTSPTKSESGFASPKLAPVSSSGRRGHAHRRSAAISSHDLSMILKPSDSPASRGSSAPTSPADFEDRPRPFPEPEQAVAEVEASPASSPAEQSTEKPVYSHAGSRSPPKSATRARVGFSDTLEFIPRPLSLVSSDTSSTMTARPGGHSVSGSISSIVSATNSLNNERDTSGLSHANSTVLRCDSRPSTAGAILERIPSVPLTEGPPSSPRRRNSIPLLTGLPLPTPDIGIPAATPSPIKTPKRWSFFHTHNSGSDSPVRSRPESSSSSESAPKPGSPSALSEHNSISASEESDPPVTSEKPPVKKPSKKHKKVKTWAGSILTRRSKSRAQKTKAARRRSQTPPLRRALSDEEYEDVAMTDQVLVPPTLLVTESVSTLDEQASTKPRSSSVPDEDAQYPMIDLDAALGPFNTPSGRDPAWEAAQRAGAPPKRQLHSAAGMRGFSGPGMHYHRRAESAPEMPPFEARLGMNRYGSASSLMEDVFEEDEEDEDDDDQGDKTGSQPTTPGTEITSNGMELDSPIDDPAITPTQEVDARLEDSLNETPLVRPLTRKSSGSSFEIKPPSLRMRSESSSHSLQDEVIHEEPFTQNPFSNASPFRSATDSGSATPSPRRIMANKDLAPVDISPYQLPTSSLMPVSPYSISHSSSFPSPRSPMSYDAQRISTAPSSVTDENNFQSLLMGEPGPEVVRISVDDIPSLTSSNSTMTRDSAQHPAVRPRNMPFHDQRPASFTSTAFGRRRSSLASLSRLISSAHGERSKLSMEVPLDNEPEKKPKVSKAKRLSRMMQFWKGKESNTS